MCNSCLSRRHALQGLMATGLVTSVGACSTNTTTGRNQLDLISDDELETIADASWEQTLDIYPRSKNAALAANVQSVGQRVADASGVKADWEFVLFAEDMANAFVLPNGKVGIFEGLFRATKNDDQLAAVMGHETGHVIARHSAERYSQRLASSIGSALVTAIFASRSGVNAQTAQNAGDLFGMGTNLAILLRSFFSL